MLAARHTPIVLKEVLSVQKFILKNSQNRSNIDILIYCSRIPHAKFQKTCLYYKNYNFNLNLEAGKYEEILNSIEN